MGKKNTRPVQDEFFTTENTSTYQTGPTHGPKRSSGLIAVLLVLTIFLGGLASGLGLVNIRLLTQLMDENQPTVPLNMQGPSSSESLASDPVLADDIPVPVLPAERNVQLTLADPPKRGENAAGMTGTDIYTQNAPSMVLVHSSNFHATNTGMGIVIHSDGYLLTNAHHVNSASRIFVELPDGSQYRATVAGVDILTDLAVLYIDAEGLQPVTLGESKYLSEGDSVASASEMFRSHLSDGAILDTDRQVKLGKFSVTLLQTTVGSHQGPVFNRYGQMIGLNVGGMSEFYDLTIQRDVGYALPSGTIQDVAQQLIAKGFVAGRPTLDVQTEVISKIYQQYWDLPSGLRLLQVQERAKAMGLQEGDILLSLGEKRLASNEDLYRILFTGTLGQQLPAEIFRDGQVMTLTLTILEVT